MKINKKVKIAVGSLFCVVLLLFVVLVIHIATAKPIVIENATIQVSRIDFDKPFDSIGAIDIQNKIKTIPGVKSDVIVKRNVIVFFHDNKIANSEKVYNQLMALGNYNAQRFILPENLASKKVCPVMNRDSFSYKFSRGIQSIFN
jgi:hypothetical protein